MKNRLITIILALLSVGASYGQRNITGTVRGANDQEVIPGVTVRVKGLSTGTITNIDGQFNIEVDNDADVLIFSFIGMQTVEEQAGSRSLVDVLMTSGIMEMDEVVAVGYGTQRKGNLTGSVASVKSDKLTIAPTSSTTNSLTGTMPGLVSKQASGLPGADDATLSIRGFGTPLVIVDGIATEFNNIDANQIESVSILKDGAASIYGARAGNGVILVTTKKGNNSKPTINVNTSYTLQGFTSFLKASSSGQLAEMQRETHLNAGNSESDAPWTEEEVAKFYAGDDPNYPNTDWYDATFKDWAPQQNHNISLNGGSDKVRYYGFFGFTDQETTIRDNGGGYNRYNAQLKVDADVTDRLKVTMDVSIISENQELPVRGLQEDGALWQDYYSTEPWWPSSLPDADKVAWGGIATGSVYASSNMDISGYKRVKESTLRGTFMADYDFGDWVTGLTAKAFVNVNESKNYAKSYRIPVTYYTYDYDTEEYAVGGAYSESNLQEWFDNGLVITQNYSLNYSNVFNDVHRVSALALFESIDEAYHGISTFASDLLSPEMEVTPSGSSAAGSASETGRTSYVGRLNYGYKDKYLIETIFRADASAKFAKEERWGYFPSVSLGWVVTGEEFMKDVTALDFAKVRASYGESGNDNVGDFNFLSGYSMMAGTYILDGSSAEGIYITGLANPNLTWEEMITYNTGVDFSLLNRALYGTVEAFYRKREGIPGTRTNSLPSTFGASLPEENLHSQNNRGFELLLGTAGNSGDFKYDVSGNISWSRAKWDYYDEPVYEDEDQKRIYGNSGEWTDRVMGYDYDKLFTSQDEIDNLGYDYDVSGTTNDNLRLGDVMYNDINGDGVLDWKDQKEIGQGTTPHWIYGFSSNMSYKDFDMSFLFQGAFGYNTNIDIAQYNTEKKYTERWTAENNDAYALVPRLGGAGSNSATSELRYISTSYLRLKSFSLGYNIPKEVINKANISNLRIYFAGTNLLTFSNISKYGVDPEMPSSLKYYPQQKTLSLGLNMTF